MVSAHIDKVLPKSYRESPKLLIAHLWYMLLITSFVYIIVAIVAAHAHTIDGSGDDSMGFTAIWSMLLLVALGVAGTFVLRRKRNSPIVVGMLVGISVMMANLQFIVFVVFTGLADEGVDSQERSATRAVAAFSFISAFLHVCFVTSLHAHREELFAPPETSSPRTGQSPSAVPPLPAEQPSL